MEFPSPLCIGQIGFYTLCSVWVGDLVKSQHVLCFVFHSAKKACTNSQKLCCKSSFGPHVQPNCYFACYDKPLFVLLFLVIIHLVNEVVYFCSFGYGQPLIKGLHHEDEILILNSASSTTNPKSDRLFFGTLFQGV